MGLCERMSAFESVLCYMLMSLKRKVFSGGAGSREKVWSVCPGHRGRTAKEAKQTTQKSQAQVSHSYWVSPVMCFVLSHVCACEHGLHVYAYKHDLCVCVWACIVCLCALACMCVCVHVCEHAWCACACVRMHACLWVHACQHAFLQSLCACVCSLKKKVTVISILLSIL